MEKRLKELCRDAAISCGMPSVDMPLIAEYLARNGVVALPCKVGDTVYIVEPLIYSIWGDDEHKCRKCDHFYEGGMGDPPDCSLGKKRCYHIVEEVADLRKIADWITPSMFLGEIAWGKTVFLNREEAEKAFEEKRKQK